MPRHSEEVEDTFGDVMQIISKLISKGQSNKALLEMKSSEALNWQCLLSQRLHWQCH